VLFITYRLQYNSLAIAATLSFIAVIYCKKAVLSQGGPRDAVLSAIARLLN